MPKQVQGDRRPEPAPSIGWCADGRHPIQGPAAKRAGVQSTFLDSDCVPADRTDGSRLSTARENAPEIGPGPTTTETRQIPGQKWRSQVRWQYQSMVRATSRSVVVQEPRVVHHCKLASKGTPLIPASISAIQ